MKILLTLLAIPLLLAGCASGPVYAFVEGHDTRVRENVLYVGRSRLTGYPQAGMDCGQQTENGK